jgi:hypothetical protein
MADIPSECLIITWAFCQVIPGQSKRSKLGPGVVERKGGKQGTNAVTRTVSTFIEKQQQEGIDMIQ